MTPADLGAALTALGYGAYVPLLLVIAGLAAKIAAVAPQATEASPLWWRIGRPVLDVLGGNWGNARNAPVERPADFPAADVDAALAQLRDRNPGPSQPPPIRPQSVTRILNNAPPN